MLHQQQQAAWWQVIAPQPLQVRALIELGMCPHQAMHSTAHPQHIPQQHTGVRTARTGDTSVKMLDPCLELLHTQEKGGGRAENTR